MADHERFPADLPIYRHLGRTSDERSWLSSLPTLVEEFERRWSLRVGRPFATGSAAWVAPAVREDGSSAVLKVSWPHAEASHEAAGLVLWGGDGAARVLAADAENFVLLLERCVPGTPLAACDLPVDQVLDVAASLLRRLWRPAPAAAPLPRLEDVAARWAGLVRERMRRFRPPFDSELVECGARLLEELPQSSTRRVLLHGDFNPENVLMATRQPWLTIDPKPMLGDPAYDPEPVLFQVDDPMQHQDPVRSVVARHRLFADLVGESADRMLLWALARRVEAALWHLARDEPQTASRRMDEASLLARAAP